MKEKIFVDIDEVCARTIEDSVLPYVNSKYGTKLNHDDIFNYRDVFWNHIQENGLVIEMDRKIEIFKNAVLEDIWRNLIRPVSWAVEWIIKLSENFEIGMLTARHQELTEYTLQWVELNYKWYIEKILFSNCYYGGKRTKADICLEEWVKIMIEDDIDYALDIARKWILVFLLNKPWNINRPETHINIRRVKNWDEILV